MRIRKRHSLLSLSSFSPVPSLSDPHLLSPSPVVQFPPPSPISDHPIPDASLLVKPYALEQDGRAAPAETNASDSGKGSILHSQTVPDHLLSSSIIIPSNHGGGGEFGGDADADGRWYEGEKAIPLKKRKGRLESIKMEEEQVWTWQNNDKKKKVVKGRMKTKMNKKCLRTLSEEEEEEEEEEEKKAGRKKRGRVGRSGNNALVMEGSRCSRVNGRGWRCCQQTLVGYSLCEHHLGKGRLRSISTVKTTSIFTPPPPPPLHIPNNLDNNVAPTKSHSPSSLSTTTTCSSSSSPRDHELDHHKLQPETVILTKKRVKLGIVKARSISSLLQQPDIPYLPLLPPHNHNK